VAVWQVEWGGLMALGTRLMGLGLGMGENSGVARELFKFGRDTN